MFVDRDIDVGERRPTSQPNPKASQVQSAVEGLEVMIRNLMELQGPIKAYLQSDTDCGLALERLEGIAGLCKKQLAANRVYAARSLAMPSEVGGGMSRFSPSPSYPRQTGDIRSLCSGVRDDAGDMGMSPSFPDLPASRVNQNSLKHQRMSVSMSFNRSTGSRGDTSGMPSFGTCLTAGLYFMMETLLIRTESDRVTLFLENPSGELCAAMRVGAGIVPLACSREVPVSATSLIEVVRATGIAASLNSVDLADVAESPGPTLARNTLIFPLQNFSRPHRIDGCIQLVNKRKGLEPFGIADEVVVDQLRPSIACLLHRYPVPIPLPPFDPTPLYSWNPLPQYSLPTLGLDASLTATPKQLVFHRNAGDRFTAKFWMNNIAGSDVIGNSGEDGGGSGDAKLVQLAGEGLSAGASLLDVESYMKTMDDCWRSSVAEAMLLEGTVKQKQSHINDAREIISRKQKKLELLKNTLVDEVNRHLRGTSALTGGLSGAMTSQGRGMDVVGSGASSRRPPHPPLPTCDDVGFGNQSGRVQRRRRKVPVDAGEGAV